LGRQLKKEKESGSFTTKLASAVIIVLMILTGAVGYLLYQGGTDGESIDLIIPRGTSLNQVASILSENEVIDQPQLFKGLLRLTQGSSRVRAGEFRFRKGMRAIDALLVLYHDAPIVHSVTIPEGFTVRQIARVLADATLVNEQRFIDLTLNAGAAQKFKISAPSLEGFLYPNTYAFSKIDGEERIIDRMVQQFLTVYNRDIRAEAQAKGMSMLELVTFASVVEKETGVADERPLVASVFHNRLKKKMRLQSDPTTIYGIKDFDGNLTRAHLRAYSPYNTYVIPGLPPGPIANPGDASMRAVLRPANSPYLYFVATGKGRHVFSETYAEHARRVTTYQLKSSSK